MKDSKLTQKLMFRLLPAQILLASIGSINGIVSSLFAGNFVGVKAMSAVGLYSPINLALGAINTMIVGGSTILCGSHIGRNDKDGIHNVFVLNMVISGALALLATVGHLIFGLSGNLISVSGDPEVSRILSLYVLGQALGVFPLMIGSQLSAFLSLDNKAKRTMTAGLVYIVTNFILNFLFVGVMRLEALGLALAPSIGLWVYLLIQVPCFMKKDSPMHLDLHDLDWKEAGSIIKIGVPGAAGTAYIALRGVIVNSLIMAYVGAVGISAFTAVNSFLSLFWSIPGGMLVVSRMLTSVSVGEEDRKSLIDVMRTALFNFIPILAALAIFIMLFAEPLTRLYYRDPSDPVYMMTVIGFRILPFAMPLSIICTHFSNYWQASGRSIPVHILSSLDGVGDVVFFSMLLIGKMGVTAVYTANVLNGFIPPIVVLLYACIYNKHFPKTLDELMSVPADFGVPVYGRIDITLKDMDSVLGVSKELQGFCMQKRIDKKRAMYASLCLEEMAGNIMQYGMTADKKHHNVNLCLACKPDTLIMSIKDDCIPFDIEEKLKMMDQEDVTKNIGIRLVQGLASDLHYQNVLGLNVLTIKLDGHVE